MASIWKGSLSFGLVNIPVEVRTAIQGDHISFRMLHEEDHTPIKYERVSSTSGDPVPWGEIVKGYEYEKNKYVIITDEDFKTAAVEASKTLEIVDFVKEEEIDPRYFETPYFLVPSKGGEKAYALLREAIRKTGSVGIGKIIMRQKQHLAGIRVVGEALILEIMRFANELIDPETLSLPDSSLVRPQELNMAEQLVTSLAEPFDPTKYTDEYRANLMRLIHGKMKGKKVNLKPEDSPARGSDVMDLMARLRESLESGKKKGAVRSRPNEAAARERKPASKSKTAKTAKRARRKTA
ncbi:MAG TPA: Ku protein [Gemmatimonadaceae bacterium]|nr:Ku protein [Gemmatimonadaceae bacterium]